MVARPETQSEPRRTPWGPALSLWSDPVGFYESLARTQGDVAHTRIGWRNLYLLNHPELVQELMVIHHPSLSKGYSLTRTSFLLGDGLLTSEGDLHARQRRLIQPAFHSQRLAAYGEIMSRFAAETGSRWRDGEELDVVKEMMRLSQRIVAKCLFDTDIEDRDARQASAALDDVIAGFRLLMLPLSQLFVSLPLPATRRLQRARRALDRLIYRMIDERRRTGDRGDVLSMLLFARGEDGGGMSDRQIRDEAMTIFLAGHDTLGNAMAWTWFLLSQNAEAERAWHRELDGELGDCLPGAAELPRLQGTRRLLAESMRLYPPVWSFGRQVREPLEIGGRALARGDIAQVCQWLLHRDGRWFPEPERFVPERWTAEFEQRLPKGAYVPFGLGPRLCIGMQFAWMAGILALATLGRRWRMRLVPGHLVALEPRITLRPRHGLKMSLRQRRAEPAAERHGSPDLGAPHNERGSACSINT